MFVRGQSLGASFGERVSEAEIANGVCRYMFFPSKRKRSADVQKRCEFIFFYFLAAWYSSM